MPQGTGVITGTVVDARTSQPIGGVTVSIAGGGLPAAERVMTDTEGQFVFQALPNGTFQIAAKRSGYLDGAYGRRAGGMARGIPLDDGERRTGITIALLKPGMISGTITDEAGDPLVKMTVVAYRRIFVGGRPRLRPAGEETTDDRGLYRISRLVPGDYVIAVPIARTSGDDADSGGALHVVRDGGLAASRLPTTDDGKAQKYPTTYYPAAPNAARATVISVAFGEARRSVDLQLRPAKALTVSGSAMTNRGPAGKVQIQLIAAGEDDVGGSRNTASVVTTEGGSFTMNGIPSGQYVLRASLLPQPDSGGVVPAQWAEQIISVGDKDFTDISLFLRPAFRVSGRFDFAGAGDNLESSPLRNLTVTLDPANTRYPQSTLPVAVVDPVANTFTVNGVLPGRYVVRQSGEPRGWVLKSVMHLGRDVSLSPLEVEASDVSGVLMTFTDRPTELTGNVSGLGDNVQAGVLVFPQDPQSWTDFGPTPRAVRWLTVRGSGTFETRGLPPGDYLVVALDAEGAVDWQNPSFLQTVARLATRVRLVEGDTQTIDVRIVDIR